MNRANGEQARRLDVEFLYLDLKVCARCQGMERSLEEATSAVAPILELRGTEVNVGKVHVQSEEQARELGFGSSPTIRINGRDIQPARAGSTDVIESPCECGASLCGETVNCREWVYQGETYATPPVGLIVDALLGEIYGHGETSLEGTWPVGDVPDNLKSFFEAKENKVDERQEASCCGAGSSKGCC